MESSTWPHICTILELPVVYRLSCSYIGRLYRLPYIPFQNSSLRFLCNLSSNSLNLICQFVSGILVEPSFLGLSHEDWTVYSQFLSSGASSNTLSYGSKHPVAIRLQWLYAFLRVFWELLPSLPLPIQRKLGGGEGIAAHLQLQRRQRSRVVIFRNFPAIAPGSF